MGEGYGDCLAKGQGNLQFYPEDNYVVLGSYINNLRLVFMTPGCKRDPIIYPVICFGTVVIL